MNKFSLVGVTLAILLASSQPLLAVPVDTLLVPDGGSTFGLLTLAILGLGFVAKQLRRNK